LEALTGLLFGFAFMIFTIYLFISVGKERWFIFRLLI
jgi:hypothetical protein